MQSRGQVLTGNLERGVASNLGFQADEQVEVLVQSAGVRISRIVSKGHRSPDGFWYDQDEDEFVLLAGGSADLLIEGEEVRRLQPGDWVHIPAHAKHRVEWTEPHTATIWLAVFWPAPSLND